MDQRTQYNFIQSWISAIQDIRSQCNLGNIPPEMGKELEAIDTALWGLVDDIYAIER